MDRFLCRSAAVAVFVLVPFAVAAGQEPSAEKARELYRLIGGDSLVQQAADAMLVGIRTNPQLAPYEDVIQDWFRKTMGSGEFETSIVAIYQEAFTGEEIDGLIAFYRSPLGQKALAKMPALMKKGAEIGARIGKDHSAELEEMIETRRKELEEKEKNEEKPVP